MVLNCYWVVKGVIYLFIISNRVNSWTRNHNERKKICFLFSCENVKNMFIYVAVISRALVWRCHSLKGQEQKLTKCTLKKNLIHNMSLHISLVIAYEVFHDFIFLIFMIMTYIISEIFSYFRYFIFWVWGPNEPHKRHLVVIILATAGGLVYGGVTCHFCKYHRNSLPLAATDTQR